MGTMAAESTGLTRAWARHGGVRVVRRAVASAALVAAAVACGPSFQAIYEGNARFEHCYALEEQAHATLHDKAACWRDWSEHYTYGQTRDRIQYAIARYVALRDAPNVPTDEALMMAAPGMTPRPATVSVPAPTNAFAPPPKTLQTLQAPASSAAPASRSVDASTGAETAPLPGASCTEKCEGTYKTCGDQCETSALGGLPKVGEPSPSDAGAVDAGARSPACHACVMAYRSCMRACFK